MNWLIVSYAAAILAGVSLILGIISKLIGAPIIWNGPKSYLGFTVVCLIFACYCSLLNITK